MHILMQPLCGRKRWNMTVYSTVQNFTFQMNYHDQILDPSEPKTLCTAPTGTHFWLHTNTCTEKYTQMVAQETICFCWHAPRPLIKHELVRHSWQTSPSPNKALCLILQIWVNTYLFSVTSLVCFGIGSCWVLPPRGRYSSWDVHFLIKYI